MRRDDPAEEVKRQYQQLMAIVTANYDVACPSVHVVIIPTFDGSRPGSSTWWKRWRRRAVLMWRRLRRGGA